MKDFEKKRRRQKEKEQKKLHAQLKKKDKTILHERSKIGKNRLILLFSLIIVSAIVVFLNIR